MVIIQTNNTNKINIVSIIIKCFNLNLIELEYAIYNGWLLLNTRMIDLNTDFDIGSGGSLWYNGEHVIFSVV